jgi:hypothetical protein
MNDHLKSNLGTGQVATRVLFSLGITAGAAVVPISLSDGWRVCGRKGGIVAD